MVHITNKLGHLTTGFFGIPNVNDCNGTISRAQWDDIVRKDAIAAQEEAAMLQQQKKQRQAEQCAYLERQMDMKQHQRLAQKASETRDEVNSLEQSQQVMQLRQGRDLALNQTYREYLQRCHAFSEASRAISANDTSPRKVALQKGSGIMPFIVPSEALRLSIEAAARLDKGTEARRAEERQRSTSPRDMHNGRWRVQQAEYEKEVVEIARQAQLRESEAERLRTLAERRAQRATAVAPPPRPQASLGLSTSSPRHTSYPSRKQVQDALRQSLEEQLREKREREAEALTQSRQADKQAMQTLNDTILSARKQELAKKDKQQTTYRAALERQFGDHPPTERGFLPEVAVKPYRNATQSKSPRSKA